MTAKHYVQSAIDLWEAEVIKDLRSVPQRAQVHQWNDSTWTREVKRVVGDIGVKHEFYVCASGWPGVFDNEWVFDVVWYKNDKDNHLVSIPLALESEWLRGSNDLKWDFEKLLVSKALLRVFVHQARTKSAVNEAQRGLIALISKFDGSVKGDRYLFAGLDWGTNEFLFRPITYGMQSRTRISAH